MPKDNFWWPPACRLLPNRIPASVFGRPFYAPDVQLCAMTCNDGCAVNLASIVPVWRLHHGLVRVAMRFLGTQYQCIHGGGQKQEP